MWARIKLGHFPTYSNPDPKVFPTFYFVEVILMMIIPLSFVLWVISNTLLLQQSRWKVKQPSFWLGILGFSLIVLLVVFDPMGILNWLAD
jgi:hypothetical protein